MRPLAVGVAVCLLRFAPEAGAQPAEASQASVLTLDEAVRLALDQNRDLRLASHEVEKADAQVEAVRTQRYPRLNVGFLNPNMLTDLELRLGPVGALGLPRHFAFATGTAAQPLSQLYDIGLGVKAAELSRDVASERHRAARQEVVNQVKRAYYGCLRAEAGLKPAREALGLFREIERVVGSLVDERAALEADLLEAQARRARQEHDVLQLEDALATGHERLNVALGRDALTPFELAPVPEAAVAAEDLASARARILEQRPDVREARVTIDLARTDERLKKAERWPRVAAAFAYLRNINMPLLPPDVAAVVVQASWEPFEWGRNSKELAVRRLAVSQAETALRQLESAATVDLNARFRALREARALIAATELGERAASERLRVALDRHREGAALTRDLLQAQLGLADADQQYQAALLGYWEARADFEKATAED